MMQALAKVSVFLRLVLLAWLLSSLAGHSIAMASPLTLDTVTMHHAAMAMPMPDSSVGDQHATFEDCCVFGHCLLGVIGAVSFDTSRVDAAVPDVDILAVPLGVIPKGPDRPPRRS